MNAVTRESLQNMLDNSNQTYVMHVVGRALVALFNRQTESEKSSDQTNVHNTIGFSGADARSGSLTAKYFMKHGRLEDWQINRWTKIQSNGYARLTKYHRQLNDIAQSKVK